MAPDRTSNDNKDQSRPCGTKNQSLRMLWEERTDTANATRHHMTFKVLS